MAGKQKGKHKAGRFPPGETPPGARPWSKGESGNPNGYSRGRRLAKILNAELDKALPGDPKGRTAATLVMQALLREAVRGSVAAAALIFNRVDGPTPEEWEGEIEPSPSGVGKVLRLRVGAADFAD